MSHPQEVYEGNGWEGWPKFLGTENRSSKKRSSTRKKSKVELQNKKPTSEKNQVVCLTSKSVTAIPDKNDFNSGAWFPRDTSMVTQVFLPHIQKILTNFAIDKYMVNGEW